MKNLEELKSRYKQLGEEIERLESTGKRWRAERGKGYYYLDVCGEVERAIEQDDSFDNYNYNTGNYFQTRQEVKTHRKKQLLIQELKDFAGGGEFVEGDKNYLILYYYENKTFDTSNVGRVYGINDIYFHNRERAEEAIEHFGDRLKLLINA